LLILPDGANQSVSQKSCLVAGEDDEKVSQLISEIPKFHLPTDPNHFYILTVPSQERGVAHVINVGRDAVDAGSARWTNRADADGEVVWF
jgi:hypothetical protein